GFRLRGYCPSFEQPPDPLPLVRGSRSFDLRAPMHKNHSNLSRNDTSPSFRVPKTSSRPNGIGLNKYFYGKKFLDAQHTRQHQAYMSFMILSVVGYTFWISHIKPKAHSLHLNRIFVTPFDNEFKPAANDGAGIDVQMGGPDQEGEPDGDTDIEIDDVKIRGPNDDVEMGEPEMGEPQEDVVMGDA
ncbi:hypothetical protein F5887DRAFT_1186114, partial [Amanita rubescens]